MRWGVGKGGADLMARKGVMVVVKGGRGREIWRDGETVVWGTVAYTTNSLGPPDHPPSKKGRVRTHICFFLQDDSEYAHACVCVVMCVCCVLWIEARGSCSRQH